MAGDQATASFRSRRTAMNSSSQPAGTRSCARPGAALMPTAATRSASATHHGRGGSLCPARIRRPPRRRAGSMNTASTPDRPASRASARTARTLPATPQAAALAWAMRRWSGSMLNGEHRVMPGQRDQVPADPAAQVRYLPGVGIAARAVPGHGLRAGLLQAGAGEEHPPRPAELGPRLEPQLMLREGVGDELGRILGAQGTRGPQRGGGRHRLPVQALQQFTSPGAEQCLETPQAHGRGAVRRPGDGVHSQYSPRRRLPRAQGEP